MKTFNRAHLPKQVNYNNKIYIMGDKQNNSVLVKVLHPRLRGKTDLHGKPYKPSEFYFNPTV